MNTQGMAVQLMATSLAAQVEKTPKEAKGKACFKDVMDGQTSAEKKNATDFVPKESENSFSEKKVVSCVKADGGKIPEKLEKSMKNFLSLEEDQQMGSEEMQAVLATGMAQMTEQICDILDVTPEELEQMLNQMGLQITDLQNPVNIQNLVLQANGESDRICLLTDEKMGEQTQLLERSVKETANEIGKELELTSNEVFEAMEQSISVDRTEQMTEEAKFSMPEAKQQMEETGIDNVNNPNEQVAGTSDWKNRQIKENGISLTENAQPISQIQETATTLQKDAAQQKFETSQEVTVDLENAQEVNVEEALKTDERYPEDLKNTEKDLAFETATNTQVEQQPERSNVEMQVEKKTGFSVQPGGEQLDSMTPVSEDTGVDLGDGEQQAKESKTEQMFHYEQVVEQLAAVKTEQVVSVQEKVEAMQQMHEIVDQVVENIKVFVKEDTSEMAIQLNPEHLGKVNLSVIAKEGHITAQFVAENELARQALESQIQQLRDTLGEQGLKVDKVEVSVSDFSFQQENQANAEQQKEQQRNILAKELHRNLNLADIKDESQLTEDEKIAVSVMRNNGSQIDFTA